MTLHTVFCSRFLTITFLQYLILQSTRQGNHTVFLGVLGEVFLTSFLMNLALLGTLLVDLFLLSSEIVLYDLLCLPMRYLQVIACYHILDSCSKIIDI